MRISSVFVFLIVPVLLLNSCASAPKESSPLSDGQPQLLVLISLDQMRPDRIHTALPGGLGRLAREGYVFSKATLDHGLTTTCPGHVVMSTGVNPGRAGIPGNSFIDHATGAGRYCVDDPGSRNQVLGGKENRSPNVLTASTIGDWLKQGSADSRVFSVSGKDRAAITLGGKNADGVFWFHQGSERFTTSKYYADQVPDYVEAFNGSAFFETGYGSGLPEVWVHGEGSVRADDFAGESTMNSRKSGHPMNSGVGRAAQFYFSPYVDVATGELARTLLIEEKLGQRGVVDMLAVSFSATDTVGHLYGPYSAESEDGMAKLDREVGLLMDLLDEQTGGNYVLALSADHGVLPLPEWLVANEEMSCPVNGGRIDMHDFGKQVYGALMSEYQLPIEQIMGLVGLSAGGATINRANVEKLGLDFDKLRNVIEVIFERHPAVIQAWNQQELESSRSEFARLYRNSFVAGKSAHILMQVHEDCLIFRPDGTSHGSPYDYDRKVPLIFYGNRIKSGNSEAAAHSTDLAPTLAHLLSLKVPDDLDGQVRLEVMADDDD